MFQIGELSKRTGVLRETIRYYERIGLLPPPRRADNDYRVYDETDVERLRFILRARALDFALDEIGETLSFREAGDIPCPYVLKAMALHIEEIEAKIADLQRLRGELEALYTAARAIPPEELAAKGHVCHVIENQSLIRAKDIEIG